MAKNAIDLRTMSFADVEDAMDVCAWLGETLGIEFFAVRDSDLGFTIQRTGLVPRNSVSPSASQVLGSKTGFRRPSLLGFMREYLTLLTGILLIAAPYALLAELTEFIGMVSAPPWLDWAKVALGMRLLGLGLFMWGLSFIYQYFANLLLFTPDGLVYQKGLIARSVVQIRFGDIKSVSFKQSILGRLLGVGTLFLDSAATNGDVDIVFQRIRHPARVRQDIQRLIAAEVAH